MLRRTWLAALCVLIAACSGDDHSSRTPASDAGPDGETGSSDATAESEVSAEAAPLPEAAPPREGGPVTPYPPLLSETGLYADLAAETLGEGVRAYEPRYVLWSDGATKRRWVKFPEGLTIDTSDMDFWTYPVGTRAWKEFSKDGRRLETRMLHKAGPDPDDWVMIAYAWREDGTDADAVPDGVLGARGTSHDVPTADDCQTCHSNMPDRLLGVTAIQLSHDLPGLTLRALMDEGRLTAPPAAPFDIPGDAAARAALGYLHANCGNCHNPQSIVAVTIALELWQSTSSLGSVEETTAYRTAVGQTNAYSPDFTIDPGRPDTSAVIARMSARDQNQMPPLATKVVDTDGLAAVRAWIASLPLLGDGGTDGGPRDAGAD